MARHRGESSRGNVPALRLERTGALRKRDPFAAYTIREVLLAQ